MKLIKGRSAIPNKRLMLSQVESRASSNKRGTRCGPRVRQACRSYMKRAESRHQRRESRAACHWYTHEGWHGLQALPLVARTGPVVDRCTNLLDFDLLTDAA